MPEFEDENSNALIQNVADDPIITDTISPQPAFLAVERFSPLARVVCGFHSLV